MDLVYLGSGLVHVVRGVLVVPEFDVLHELDALEECRLRHACRLHDTIR